MATRQTLPPLLEPYLTALSSSTAGGSLVLLTSVLGTSTNWLVLRYLQVLLRDRQQPHHGSSPPPGGGVTVGRIGDDPGQQQEGEGGEGEEETETAVLLVSFLRDFAFWREGMARLGVDLEAAGRKGRFGFVDGLCGLLFGGSSPSPSSLPASAPRGQAQQQQQQQGWKRTLTSPKPGDVLRVVLEGVEGLKIAAQQPLQQASAASAAAARVPGNGGGIGVVGSSTRKKKKVVLIVDGLDFLLAASPPPPPPSSNTPTETPLAVTLKDLVMDWRETTHATLLTLSSDSPLIHNQETPLERQHAWFVLSLAHDADTLLSLRPLDTGAARDVSGVIRITTAKDEGSAAVMRALTTTAGETTTTRSGDDGDKEYLYHVGGDGGVRVFERGQ
ncbi:hypothetical protein VTJ04DRAFT_2372 [Mycothermus thermophilus]|uniref:uncharacterized protein n=1 Tax=Humicola insolens TaxID=85995 RepID=UPI0037440FAD